MNATAEIDKAGRIIIPKKLRTALHLVPGTRIKLEQQGDSIVLQHATSERELVDVDGVLVLRSVKPPQGFDLDKFLSDEREARISSIIGAHISE